jgi:hypothetical protein
MKKYKAHLHYTNPWYVKAPPPKPPVYVELKDNDELQEGDEYYELMVYSRGEQASWKRLPSHCSGRLCRYYNATRKSYQFRRRVA